MIFITVIVVVLVYSAFNIGELLNNKTIFVLSIGAKFIIINICSLEENNTITTKSNVLKYIVTQTFHTSYQ